MQDALRFSCGNWNKEEKRAWGYQRLHGGWCHGGMLYFGDVCLCEWLRPLSSFQAGCHGAICTGRLLSCRDPGGVTTDSCFPKYPTGLGWIRLVFALVALIRAVFRDTLIWLRAPWENIKEFMLLHLSSTEHYLYCFRSETPSEDAFFSVLRKP